MGSLMSSAKRNRLTDLIRTDIPIGRFLAVDENTFLFVESFDYPITDYSIDKSESTRSNFLEIYNVVDIDDDIVGNVIQTIPMIEIDLGESYLFLRRYISKSDTNVSEWETDILQILEGESGVLISPFSKNSVTDILERRIEGI